MCKDRYVFKRNLPQLYNRTILYYAYISSTFLIVLHTSQEDTIRVTKEVRISAHMSEKHEFG